MFKKYHALALASLLGLGALAMPASTASAASLPHVEQSLPGETLGNENLLQQVHRRRHRRGFNHFGLFLSPLVLGGGYGYGYGYPRYGYYGGSSRYYGRSGSHADWCHSRYRSYNPWNNTWRAYSGRVYQCRSPFRHW